MPRRRLRVIVADSNVMALRAIGRWLEILDGIEVVAAVSGPFPLAPGIVSLKPDLLLVDVEIGRLVGPLPAVKIALLTMHDGTELREAARQSWADAMLCKWRLDEELPAAIQRLFPSAIHSVGPPYPTKAN